MTKAGNSQINRTITLLITIFSLSLPAYAKYSGGTGEPNDPYQIATTEDLMLLGETPEDYDKHFILTADIDLDPNLPGRKVFDRAVIAPDANDTESRDHLDPFRGIPFTGVVDGNDHTISHLKITGESFLGLFGVLDSGAKVFNLGLEAVDVNGISVNVGGLVGRNYNGNITMSYSTGTVGGTHRVGGLVGWNAGHIIQSYSSVTVSGETSAGGLVGINAFDFFFSGGGYTISEGNITMSYSTGTVTGRNVGGLVGSNQGSITSSFSTGRVEGNDYVGGLVGWNDRGRVATSYSTGPVTGEDRVGGFVGENIGVISTSYSTGGVSGTGRGVGGLVGKNGETDQMGTTFEGTVMNCYSTGVVTGNELVGGLLGYHYSGHVIMSYSTGMVTGNEHVGGLVGRAIGFVLGPRGTTSASFWDTETSGQSTSNGGIGRTTTEMQDINTYLNAGWDFVDEILNGAHNYWQISTGDYPSLCYPEMPEGFGTIEEPYLIRDMRDLGTVRFEPLAHYRLEASVDLSGTTWSMAVVPWFGGSFDGNGHVIRSLHIQGDNYLGLFGELGSAAVISNLGLEAVDVNGTGSTVGGLVGRNWGNITTSYSTGKVTGNGRVGGLVGINRSSITMSSSNATVSGEGIVGGLVGENLWGSIDTSYNTGMVSGNGHVGGLAGNNYEGSITASYNTGTVRGTDWIGGLVGGNRGSITTSYSTGEVSGNYSVGGLAGRNDGDITASYSIGMVTGDEDVGGLVGRCYCGIKTSNFWDMETSGLSSSDGGIGKTTAEMQTANTFLDAGWDFVDETENGTDDIWWILEGQEYPRLWWEIGGEASP